MAASALKAWLGQPSGDFRWIEFEAYARRVFANDSADWFRDSARYAGALIQAQGVIQTQCLSIDISTPIVSARPTTDAAELVALFDSPAPREFVSTALQALVHRFEQHVDLVLKFTAPWDLLGGADDEAGFDALDDVGSALTACMRRFAASPVAGLLLETARATPLSADEVDAYQPLIDAARHYGWCTAMALPGDHAGAITSVPLALDALLWPQLATTALPVAGAGLRTGGGLTPAFWAGAAPLPAAAHARLLYGCIPAAATPETVLSVARALQA